MNHDAVATLEAKDIVGVSSLQEFVDQLTTPRTVWLMLPAAITQHVLDQLVPLLQADDVIIDGGNSYYHDDIVRAADLKEHGLHYVDCGLSGGVWGLERGYSLMIGGEADVVARLEPIFESIAPGGEPSPGRLADQASQGFLHCGPSGAGHFVKMVHNGVEYGMMASIAEDSASSSTPTRVFSCARRTPKRLRWKTPSSTPTKSTLPTSPRFGVTARS